MVRHDKNTDIPSSAPDVRKACVRVARHTATIKIADIPPTFERPLGNARARALSLARSQGVRTRTRVKPRIISRAFVIRTASDSSIEPAAPLPPRPRPPRPPSPPPRRK